MYENFSNSDLNKMAEDLLVDKEIIATDADLVDSLPFRISSDVLKFKPIFCDIKTANGGKILEVYVLRQSIEGTCTNQSYGQYSDEMAMSMVMTAWIHWNITSKNLPEHVDVMVYIK